MSCTKSIEKRRYGALHRPTGPLTVAAMLLSALLFLAGCGKKDSFTAELTFDGIGEQNVRVVYYGDDGIVFKEDAIVDSRLTITGSAPRPTVVEIYGNNNRLIGLFVVENGDKLSLGLKGDAPLWLEVKDNPVNEDLAAFTTTNSEALRSNNDTVVNRAIEEFITAHPDNRAAAVLLTRLYNVTIDPGKAVELFGMLPDENVSLADTDDLRSFLAAQTVVAPGDTMPSLWLNNLQDSLVEVFPAKKAPTLFVFRERTSRDTVIDLLDSIGVRIIDVRMSPDTLGWRRYAVKQLPEGSSAYHAPLSLIDPGINAAGVYALPFYIAVDTAAVQIYRGQNLSQAGKVLSNIKF